MDLHLGILKSKPGIDWGYYYQGWVYTHSRSRPDELHLKYLPRVKLPDSPITESLEGFMIYSFIKENGILRADPYIDFVKIR